MTPQAGETTRAAQPKSADEMRYVARQPILDLQGRVHAYDLLFRNDPETIFRRDAGLAIETMLDNEVIFGLESLTNGLPAFIECTAEALTEGWVLVLTPGLTVLGVSASLHPAPGLIDACRTLRARGFRLALDDFAWREIPHPLADRADYIRLDFRRFGEAEQRQLTARGLNSIALVAQNVETQEDYQRACAKGFTLFQGGYFCHPVLLKKRKVPANRLAHFLGAEEAAGIALEFGGAVITAGGDALGQPSHGAHHGGEAGGLRFSGIGLFLDFLCPIPKSAKR